MTELFESTIDNVSELEVKCYSDPVNMEHTMEIWTKTGDEEYIYKFTGPGVRMANIPMVDDCLKFSKEIDKLTFEKEMMKEEYEKKIKELEELKTPTIENFADEDQKIRELEEEISKLKRQLQWVKDDKKKLTDRYTALIKEWSERFKRLQKECSLEKAANEAQRTRADILDQAKKCVCGQREQDYGSPESNFQLIADLWNQYLFKEPGAKEIFGIGPMDVAMMMGLMKIARIRNGGGSGDSFVDLAGYAACGGEIWHGK